MEGLDVDVGVGDDDDDDHNLKMKLKLITITLFEYCDYKLRLRLCDYANHANIFCVWFASRWRDARNLL